MKIVCVNKSQDHIWKVWINCELQLRLSVKTGLNGKQVANEDEILSCLEESVSATQIVACYDDLLHNPFYI